MRGHRFGRFAHPDDAELTCFGTLGLLKSRGYRVLIGIVTDGLGGLAPAHSCNRVLEAQLASAVMGFELLRGALPDGDLQYSSQLIVPIEKWIRAYQPDIVITHDYDPAGIDHQDHMSVARPLYRTDRMLIPRMRIAIRRWSRRVL